MEFVCVASRAEDGLDESLWGGIRFGGGSSDSSDVSESIWYECVEMKLMAISSVGSFQCRERIIRARMSSQLPRRLMSKWLGGPTIVRLIRIWGTLGGICVIIVDTGATFNEVPITITKSHARLSPSQVLMKDDGSGSPKKITSGFKIPGEILS